MEPPPSPPLPELVRAFRSSVLAPVASRYPGKDELVELAGLALVAGDHLLIVGPPGTAKSEVVSELASRVGGRYFEYLLTRFTEPSEIFGPIDLRRLREGRFETSTAGMLPEAEIAFLDEVFHAGSAILNTLLGILNDGVFRRGSEVRRTALHSVLAATNTLVEDTSLRALQDRFTLRVAAGPLPDSRLEELLDAGWALERERVLRDASEAESRAPADFPMSSLRTLSRELTGVDVEPARGALVDLVRRLRSAGVFVSDRRVVKLQRLAAASAVLCGRKGLIASDVWPARYLWEHEDDRESLAEIVDECIDRVLEMSPPGAVFDPHGTDPSLHHPLAFPGRDPARLLEDISHLANAIARLRKAPDRTTADVIHNRLYDLDREQRWCRVRSTGDRTALDQARARLDELALALEAIEADR